MNRVLVQYMVKPETAAENEKLIRAVYEQLATTRPEGLRYATVVLDDGLTFVHIAEHDGSGASPLAGMPAFRDFQQGIAGRCDEPPVTRQANLIGSYQMFGAQ